MLVSGEASKNKRQATITTGSWIDFVFFWEGEGLLMMILVFMLAAFFGSKKGLAM